MKTKLLRNFRKKAYKRYRVVEILPNVYNVQYWWKETIGSNTYSGWANGKIGHCDIKSLKKAQEICDSLREQEIYGLIDEYKLNHQTRWTPKIVY